MYCPENKAQMFMVEFKKSRKINETQRNKNKKIFSKEDLKRKKKSKNTIVI